MTQNSDSALRAKEIYKNKFAAGNFLRRDIRSLYIATAVCGVTDRISDYRFSQDIRRGGFIYFTPIDTSST